MKEQILNYLRTCPNGARQRVIAGALRVWTADGELIKALHELQKEGKVKSTVYRDMANMEQYLIWEVA